MGRRERCAEGAADLFRRRFGAPPEAVAVAPGRVNLIGEHTDYCLLPVLPMAIDRWVAVAVGSGPEGRIGAISTAEDDPDGPTVEGWTRYVSAAVAASGIDGGVAVAVDADLPAAGGLSSSSALTVAVIAAITTWAGLDLEPDELVRRAVEAERSLGVAGGEMDQTVIVHGRAGTALRVDFLPPGRRTVPVPDDWAVLLADTGVPAPKAAGARRSYNARVVATRLGAILLADRLGMDAGSPPALGRIAGGDHLAALVEDLPAQISSAEVVRLVDGDLHAVVGDPPLVDPAVPLSVREAARHVLSEAIRVDRFEEAMRSGDLDGAGILLGDSQRSLERFGVSTPGIERLVARLQAGGAVGARLTGAGFGGHVVALCRRERGAEVAAVVCGFVARASDGVSVSWGRS